MPLRYLIPMSNAVAAVVSIISAIVRVLGTSDEVTTCDACGKTNLKRTVALSINDSDPVYYGTDCAAQTIYGKKSVRNATLVIKSAELAKCRELIARWAAAFAAIGEPPAVTVSEAGVGRMRFDCGDAYCYRFASDCEYSSVTTARGAATARELWKDRQVFAVTGITRSEITGAEIRLRQAGA